MSQPQMKDSHPTPSPRRWYSRIQVYPNVRRRPQGTAADADRGQESTALRNPDISTSFLLGASNPQISNSNFHQADGDYNRECGNITLINNICGVHQSNRGDEIDANPSADPTRSARRPQETGRADFSPDANVHFRSSAMEYATYEPTLSLRLSNEIYKRQLASSRNGSALWSPEPNNNLPIAYRRMGISIGDVGILTSSGGFDFLFNICLPADDPVNRSFGVPEGFYPVKISRPGNIYKNVDPTNFLCSKTVEVAEYKADLTDGWRFRSSAKEGAILTMPTGTIKTDLLGLLDFEEYMHANLENWYRFIMGVLSRKVDNGDVRLVMGCDKAKAWGMAVFTKASREGSLHFNFKVTGSNSPGHAHIWEYSGMAEAKTGPTSEEVEALLDDSNDEPTSPYQNQCLFVRTINASFEPEKWKRLREIIRNERIEARRKDSLYVNVSNAHAPAGPWQNDTMAGEQPGDTSTTQNSARTLATRVIGGATRTMAYHPQNIINGILLEHFTKTTGECPDIIITNDTHWMSVLKDEDVDFPAESDIVARILERYNLKMDTTGALRLEDRPLGNNGEETFPNSLASCDSSTTVQNSLLRTRLREDPPLTEVLDESILLRKELLALCPPGHSDRSSLLNGLADDPVLSWTNQDSRQSILFNSWGVLYRFQTSTNQDGQSVTTMWCAVRPNKEDRVAKLEWAPNGGLGRVVMGKNSLRMVDLVRADPSIYGSRTFTGPDGLQYRWRPSSTGVDVVLQDPNGEVIAFFRPILQTRFQIGDVYGELHYIRNAGMGTVMHPPMTDMVTLTAMLYRFCTACNTQ